MAFDVAAPGLVGVIGWAGFLAVSPVIVLAEAIVLRLLGWGTFGRSLLDAFLVNLASGLVGGCALAAGLSLQANAALWLGLLAAFVVSVAIEGGGLWLLRRRPAGETWRAALAANLVSYAGLALVLALALNPF